MIIAHIVDTMAMGGAEKLIALLSREQRAGGSAPEVHCLFDGGVLAEELAGDGIPVHVHGPTSKWSTLARLSRTLRKGSVVHCHNATATIWAAPVARLTGATTVVSTRHGLVPPDQERSRERKFWAVSRICCDRVVAVCQAAHRNLAAGPWADPSRLVTILNGAAEPEAAPEPVAVSDAFILVTVARLSPAKDQATLLRAIAIARHRVPDLRLWVIGDGSERGNLQRLAQELNLSGIVEFFGERKQVGGWLKAASVFVLSSVTEGLPVSLIEALSAGLPQLVTDVGGMPEVVALSRSGMVLPPSDPERLAAVVVYFAERRESFDQLRREARRCYEEHFTLARMVRDYAALYSR